MENMTYSQAGVDITNGNKAVDMINCLLITSLDVSRG